MRSIIVFVAVAGEAFALNVGKKYDGFTGLEGIVTKGCHSTLGIACREIK